MNPRPESLGKYIFTTTPKPTWGLNEPEARKPRQDRNGVYDIGDWSLNEPEARKPRQAREAGI